MDLIQTIKKIEDNLFENFAVDIWERGLYYYLFRHTRLINHASITIPLPKIAKDLKISQAKARECIRSLARKGCIKLEQTRAGHYINVLIPEDLNLPEELKAKKTIDIESIDFFSNRKYLQNILLRENYKCFYCLREITTVNCELDHLIAQVNGGNNSYRNIVASCHQCNTQKLQTKPEDFLRLLLRKSVLSDEDFEKRLLMLKTIINGELKPEL